MYFEICIIYKESQFLKLRDKGNMNISYCNAFLYGLPNGKATERAKRCRLSHYE